MTQSWRLLVLAAVVLGLLAVGPAGATTTPPPPLSWSPPAAFDFANGTLDSVACPSDSLCVAVDER